jgi:RNA polymerase sigma factor (sigma-70 family)
MRSDSELLAECAASGSEAVLAELAARHAPMVYRTCVRVLGDPHRAEDASQAAFVVLVRRAAKLRGEGRLAAWLHRVARNVALRALRDEALRARREKEAGMERAAREDRSAAGGAGPEVAGLLDRELDALPAAQRQAIALRYLEGRSAGEAAEVAGCPEGTLRRRAHDGLERLRRRLAGRGAPLETAALAGLLEAECAALVPDSLLPSVLTASKSAAAGAALGGVGTGVMALAEGVLKMMFWAKVRVVLAVAAGCLLAGGAIPLAVSLVRAGEPAAEGAREPLPAPRPAGPKAGAGPRVLEPLTDSGTGYMGAFTPDGRHFVYALLPAKGAAGSELRAIEVSTGKRRSLGVVPLDAAALPGARGVPDPAGVGGRGGRSSPGRGMWVSVVAATNDLGTVFLNQNVLRRAKGQYLVWRTQKKALVALNADLSRATFLGSSADGKTLAFRLSRSPLRLCTYDVAAGRVGRPFDAGIERDFCYGTDLSWAGSELFGFVRRDKQKGGKPKGTEVRALWPEAKSLGVLPTATRTLRTGPGFVKPVPCYPLFCGSPGGKGRTLVFLRGDEVLAAGRGAGLETVKLGAVPTSEVPHSGRLPAAADSARGRVYSTWLEVAAGGKVNFNAYNPAEKSLGTERKVTLKLAAHSADGKKADGGDLSFDVTALFDRLRKRAMADYRANKVPKSGSGVLTRQPWVRALAARDGRVILLFRLRVWYGICGEDYHWPLVVDCEKRSLAHSGDFGSGFSSGIRSGPPGLTHCASPRGDALAVIRGGKLLLFRTGAVRAAK